MAYMAGQELSSYHTEDVSIVPYQPTIQGADARDNTMRPTEPAFPIFARVSSEQGLIVYKDQKSIINFACCLKRKENSEEITLPRELFRHILSYCDGVIWNGMSPFVRALFLFHELPEAFPSLSDSLSFHPNDRKLLGLEEDLSMELNNREVNAENFRNLIPVLSKIIKFDLGLCTFITHTVWQMTGDEIKACFKSAKKLQLNDANIGSKALFRILASAPSIDELNLSGCKNTRTAIERVSDEVISFCVKNIKKLDVSRANISSKALLRILTHAHSLEELDLMEYENTSATIENMTYGQMSACFEGIKTLVLAYTKITPGALAKILTHAYSLEKLYLGNCRQISAAIEQMTDEEIAACFEGMKNLDLHETDITSDALARILTHAHSLEGLNVSNCNNFAAAIEQLADEQMPDELILTCFRNMKKLYLDENDLTPEVRAKIPEYIGIIDA